MNEKLKPLGVRISLKHEAFRATEDLDLQWMTQLLTEPLNGKHKASMPKAITMNYCPFCGTRYGHAPGKPPSTTVNNGQPQ